MRVRLGRPVNHVPATRSPPQRLLQQVLGVTTIAAQQIRAAQQRRRSTQHEALKLIASDRHPRKFGIVAHNHTRLHDRPRGCHKDKVAFSAPDSLGSVKRLPADTRPDQTTAGPLRAKPDPTGDRKQKYGWPDPSWSGGSVFVRAGLCGPFRTAS